MPQTVWDQFTWDGAVWGPSIKVTSLLIGGVEMVQPGGVGASPFYAALWRNFTIDQALSDKTGTASFIIAGQASVLGPLLTQRAVVKIMGGTNLLFGGEVVQIQPQAINLATGYTEYTISCRDFSYLLDEAVISTPIALSGGQTDSASIAYILSQVLPAMSSAGVSNTMTIPPLTFTNVTVRQAIAKFCSLSGCEYYVDYNKVLQYFLPSSRPATFGISDTPDLSASFYALMTGFQFTSDGTALYNQIIVIGALGSGGNPYTATANDAASQSAYGLHTQVIVDTSIQSNAEAADRAAAELAASKDPQESGTFVTQKFGLTIGQLAPIVCSKMNINASYVLREIKSQWMDQSTVNYTVSFGAYRPDVIKFLRQLALDSASPSVQPLAVSPPLSIVPSQIDHIDANSITVGTLDASVVNVVNLNASNLTSGSINASVIAVTNLSANNIVTGTLSSISINSVTITGSTLVLNLNGVTTSMDNGDPFGFGNGASWVQNSNGNYALVNPTQVRVKDGATHSSTIMIPTGLSFADASGDTVSLGLISSALAVKVQSASGPVSQMLMDRIQVGSGSTFVAEIGMSGSDGYAKFNGTYFALWHDSNKKKVMSGTAQFTSGSKAIATGLSSIDSAVAVPVSGATPSEYVGIGISSGTVTFYSSSPGSGSFFSYQIVGSI